MKKIARILLITTIAACFTIALAACGGKGKDIPVTKIVLSADKTTAVAGEDTVELSVASCEPDSANAFAHANASVNSITYSPQCIRAFLTVRITYLFRENEIGAGFFFNSYIHDNHKADYELTVNDIEDGMDNLNRLLSKKFEPAKLSCGNPGTVKVYAVASIHSSNFTDDAYLSVESDDLTITFTANEIRTADGLKEMASKPTSAYVLMNDIDLEGEPWTPIPEFTGYFDGQGHTINNLKVSVYSYNAEAGLFAVLKDKAAVKNLNLENVDVFGSIVGAVAGNVNGLNGYVEKGYSVVISGCEVKSGRVQGTRCAGGIAGKISDTVIENCKNSAEVSGRNGVGGIIGDFGRYGSIISCTNDGNIFGMDNVGGIIGGIPELLSHGTICALLNNGSVNGVNNVGGIVGYVGEYRYSEDNAVVDLKNTGSVTAAQDYAGGIIGRLDGFTGRQLSTTSSTSVRLVYSFLNNSGEINGGDYVGGIFGAIRGDVDHGEYPRGTYTISVEQAVNDGTVYGNNHVGEICGYAVADGVSTIDKHWNRYTFSLSIIGI